MSNQEAVDIARRMKDPQKAAQQLTAEALKRESKDDISCVVVRFRWWSLLKHASCWLQFIEIIRVSISTGLANLWIGPNNIYYTVYLVGLILFWVFWIGDLPKKNIISICWAVKLPASAWFGCGVWDCLIYFFEVW